MKFLSLALIAVFAAFGLRAADAPELPVPATQKLSIVNSRSLPGTIELTETEKDGRKIQSFRIRFVPDGKAKFFRAEIVMRPPLNAEAYDTFSFRWKCSAALSGNTAVFSILDSFWKSSYNATLPDAAKVKLLEAGKEYPCTADVTTQWGRPAKLNRSSLGRFNFTVNLPKLEAGKEVVLEISDMKFTKTKER